jgi:hypothetical protein
MLLLISSLTLVSVCSGVIADKSLDQEVRANLPKSFAELERFYSTLEGQFTYKVYRQIVDENLRKRGLDRDQPFYCDGLVPPENDLVESRTIDFRFKPIEQKVTVHTESKRSLDKTIGAYKTINSTDILKNSVRAKNSRYCFEIAYSGPDSQPTVRDFGRAEQRKHEYEKYFRRTVSEYLMSGCYLLHVPFSTLFEENKITIQSARERKTNDTQKRVVEIDFTFDYPDPWWTNPKDPTMTLNAGTMTVSPQNSWAIDELILSCKRFPRFLKFTTVYSHTGDRPTPQKVVMSRFFTQTIVEFETISPCQSPEKDFMLSAYGLPEMDPSPPRSSANGATIWLCGAGVVIFCMSLCVKWLGRARTRNYFGGLTQR